MDKRRRCELNLRKFKVLIIGLGRIGLLYGFDKKRQQPASHAAAVLMNKNLELVGICDSDKKSINLYKKHYSNQVKIFKNYSEVCTKLEKKEISCDIVVVSTPDSTHEKILLSLIKSLKKSEKTVIIFCEKPLTRDSRTAKIIRQRIKNTKLKIVVNHVRRWSKTWQHAKQLSKKIGSIKQASFYFSTSPENIQVDQIRDGIHIADLLSWFKIEEKTSINRIFVPYFIYEFFLWGSKGKIEILDFGETLNFYKVIKSNRFAGFKELKLVYTRKNKESYLADAYGEFVSFLQGRKVLSTGIDDGVRALEVFEKYVYDSKLSKQ
jgi:hypothetical protein